VDTPVAQLAWYWGTTVVLALLLFFPVSRLIWVGRVRRLERKLGRQATPEEREPLRRSSRIVAAVIAITFAFLYNRTLLIAG
jgi:hypothetical protein